MATHEKLIETLKRKYSEELSQIAREPVEADYCKGTLYGLCTSELGCLRLFHTYRFRKDVGIQYSENLKHWIFSYDVNMEWAHRQNEASTGI